MGSVRVAIVGVGNCAASLVQGVEYYKDADPATKVPGLMHVQFGDYHVRDVEFVAAFDVDAKKVGLDLADAIGASENNTIKICDVPPSGVTVQRGHTYDGLGKYYREMVTESDDAPVDVVAALKDKQVDVLVCYLPVGSEEAAKYYAQCAIDAGVAFVNALPVFIAGTKEWADKFTAAGAEIIAISVDNQDKSRELVNNLKLPFPVLSDTGHVAIDTYGLFNPDGKIAKPAVFVVDRTGVVRWSFLDEDYKVRAVNDTILTVLKTVK